MNCKEMSTHGRDSVCLKTSPGDAYKDLSVALEKDSAHGWNAGNELF